MTAYVEREACAILVGATGAFGMAITQRLLDAGLGVIAVARSADSLQALTAQNHGVRACVADIGNDSAIGAVRSVIPGFSAELRPFGEALFSGGVVPFSPATDLPVPLDYVIGPGDVLELRLFGKENKSFQLTVDRSGAVNLPERFPGRPLPVAVPCLLRRHRRFDPDHRLGGRRGGHGPGEDPLLLVREEDQRTAQHRG